MYFLNYLISKLKLKHTVNIAKRVVRYIFELKIQWYKVMASGVDVNVHLLQLQHSFTGPDDLNTTIESSLVILL